MGQASVTQCPKILDNPLTMGVQRDRSAYTPISPPNLTADPVVTPANSGSPSLQQFVGLQTLDTMTDENTAFVLTERTAAEECCHKITEAGEEKGVNAASCVYVEIRCRGRLFQPECQTPAWIPDISAC